MAEGGSDPKDLTIIVKWAGKEFNITLPPEQTVKKLRMAIYNKTDVRPDRQRLINLKFKGKPADDFTQLKYIICKQNYKLMMIGSTEEAIEEVRMPPDEFIDIDDHCALMAEEAVCSKSKKFSDQIQKLVRNFKITELNPPREGKRLLVLDIKYSPFEPLAVGEPLGKMIRPKLHEFLKSVYEYYNIVIWSTIGLTTIEQKMGVLDVSPNPDYKIWFYLDSKACVVIDINYKNEGSYYTKPLGVIWGKYPQYSSKNTIIIDDIRRHFTMNVQSGLRTKALRNVSWLKESDTELGKLSTYLINIALHCDDFTKLNHLNWESFKKPKP